jgi:hypothetical protein
MRSGLLVTGHCPSSSSLSPFLRGTSPGKYNFLNLFRYHNRDGGGFCWILVAGYWILDSGYWMLAPLFLAPGFLFLIFSSSFPSFPPSSFVPLFPRGTSPGENRLNNLSSHNNRGGGGFTIKPLESPLYKKNSHRSRSTGIFFLRHIALL